MDNRYINKNHSITVAMSRSSCADTQLRVAFKCLSQCHCYKYEGTGRDVTHTANRHNLFIVKDLIFTQSISFILKKLSIFF